MVLEFKMKAPDWSKVKVPDWSKIKAPDWNKMKISRVVLISGLLTFLYLIEFCIGIRTVYYAFSLWNKEVYLSSETPMVSWTLCVACLLVCVSSSFTINLISAMWEQKQIKEAGKEKNATRFAFHIVVGGMIWRYVCLWFSDNKELQKKESMLLSITKFLFTQFFTIPLIIVHASLVNNLEEIIYIVCSVLCISVNLILTCIIFSWCKTEVKQLKTWNYETLDLVPLIFSDNSNDPQEVNDIEHKNETSLNKVRVNEQGTNCEPNEDNVEIMLMRTTILFQTFGFTFGRLLALGILLRLAGIYAVSIMFLQLLLSVVYLKFQNPFLVSDSLPKWRQLTRLAFMSYILIFEWHLNRDPKTGYDFTSNTKHSMLYYCIATAESVFYFIAWAITDSYVSDDLLDELKEEKHKLVRDIIIIGTLSLISSLIIYFILTMWKSRRLSVLMHSIRRHYLTTKLKVTNSMRNKCGKPKQEVARKPSKSEISNPAPFDGAIDNQSPEYESDSTLEKHSSYRDLRDPVDDEIEIFVGGSGAECEVASYSDQTNEDRERTSMTKMEYVQTNACLDSKPKGNAENGLNNKFDKYKKKYESPLKDKENDSCVGNSPVKQTEAEIEPGCNANNNDINEKTVGCHNKLSPAKIESKGSDNKPTEQIQAKSKISQFSESIGEGWNKFSALSKKFTGTMRDQILKRKEQFQNVKVDSITSNNKMDIGPKEKSSPVNSEKSIKLNAKESSVSKHSDGAPEDDLSEGYFVGDVRCYDEERRLSVKDDDNNDTDIEINDEVERQSAHSSFDADECEETSDSDTVHHIGNDPCPCFVCRHADSGRSHLRRRSSVPAMDRKVRFDLERLSKEKSTASYPSSPTSVHVDMKHSLDFEQKLKEKTSIKTVSPKVLTNGSLQSLSFLPLENRVEHFV